MKKPIHLAKEHQHYHVDFFCGLGSDWWLGVKEIFKRVYQISDTGVIYTEYEDLATCDKCRDEANSLTP